MKRILIPVDFSELSGYARDLAIRISKATGAEIHLLHVVPLPSHILLTPEGDLFDDGEMDVSIPKKKKEETVVLLNNWIQDASIGVTTCVCFGHVNAETVRYAERYQADLIVMATHGSTGVKELITGSHAENVSMHVTMPVLTLKCERPDLELRSIVLAGSFNTNDVPHSELLLELQKTFQSKLYLLRVNTPKDFLSDHEAISHMKAFAAKHALENVEFAVYNDLDVEEGIMHFAANENIELIAIGSMQRTGLNKFINGCVSADLVNHVYKPLLTFKLKD